MTQPEIIRELFKQHGFVTNGMLKRAGITHSGRNRIREMEREEFVPAGQFIDYKKGPDFDCNTWTLRRIPGWQPPDPPPSLVGAMNQTFQEEMARVDGLERSEIEMRRAS